MWPSVDHVSRRLSASYLAERCLCYKRKLQKELVLSKHNHMNYCGCAVSEALMGMCMSFYKVRIYWITINWQAVLILLAAIYQVIPISLDSMANGHHSFFHSILVINSSSNHTLPLMQYVCVYILFRVQMRILHLLLVWFIQHILRTGFSNMV